MSGPDDLEEPARAICTQYHAADVWEAVPSHAHQGQSRAAYRNYARACLHASPLLKAMAEWIESSGDCSHGAIQLLTRYARLTDTDGDRNAE